MASMAAIPVVSRTLATPTATRDQGSSGARQRFKDYIKDPKAKIAGTKMMFAGIRTSRKSTICGLTSSKFDAEGNIKK